MLGIGQILRNWYSWSSTWLRKFIGLSLGFNTQHIRNVVDHTVHCRHVWLELHLFAIKSILIDIRDNMAFVIIIFMTAFGMSFIRKQRFLMLRLLDYDLLRISSFIMMGPWKLERYLCLFWSLTFLLFAQLQTKSKKNNNLNETKKLYCWAILCLFLLEPSAWLRCFSSSTLLTLFLETKQILIKASLLIVWYYYNLNTK